MTALEMIIPAAISLVSAGLGFLGPLFISERQRTTAFRMAALDRRLKTHQEAYRLWHEMVWALHDAKKRPETVARCQEWWIDNSLYLDARSREEFLPRAREAGLYEVLNDGTAEKAASFNRIKNVFKLLEEGVHLPSIGGLEEPPVKR